MGERRLDHVMRRLNLVADGLHGDRAKVVTVHIRSDHTV